MKQSSKFLLSTAFAFTLGILIFSLVKNRLDQNNNVVSES